MELSKTTIEVLRNFSTINSSIVVQPGKVLKTMAEARNILADAFIDEEFPQTFGIYDLNEFLNVLGLLDGPRLKFTEAYVLIGDSTGRSRVKYYFSDPEILTTPTKDIEMPEASVEFTIDAITLAKIQKASSLLGHSEVCVSVVDNVLNLSVVDAENVTGNVFSIDVDGTFTDDKFKCYILTDNIKVVPGNYDVQLSSKLISKFTNKERSLNYFIACEKRSTFGE
jgi:hypothetical protein|tara:strand:- start:22226 stop:22900 length:675 start_codon:yes stop_codon:yes gene_type:complete